MKLSVKINTIPHDQHLYTTVGCWFWEKLNQDDTSIHIRVSRNLPNDDIFLVALHELVESYLCSKKNISTSQVNDWDMKNPDVEEPGEVAGAPYFQEHKDANDIEKLMCEKLNLNWDEHNKKLENLCNG